jgi:hypothetical protein
MAELEEFVLKTERLTLNNFCLREEPGTDNPGSVRLKVMSCYRNRIGQPVQYSLVVVGQDEEGDILWACTLPGTAPAGEIGLVEGGAVQVPAGTLTRTATVRLRAAAVPVETPRLPGSTSGSPSWGLQPGYSR